jgi:hypothetical protein
MALHWLSLSSNLPGFWLGLGDGMKWRRVVAVVCLVVNILSAWIMWEAVVKPLKDCCPKAWSREFPAPFYLWEAPIWLWHDLAIF